MGILKGENAMTLELFLLIMFVLGTSLVFVKEPKNKKTNNEMEKIFREKTSHSGYRGPDYWTRFYEVRK